MEKNIDSCLGIWENSSPITQEFVLNHGWTVETITIPDPQPVDETDFQNACNKFKQVCYLIGQFIRKRRL